VRLRECAPRRMWERDRAFSCICERRWEWGHPRTARCEVTADARAHCDPIAPPDRARLCGASNMYALSGGNPSVMLRAACRGCSRCISRVRAHPIASLIARLCSSIVSAASASTSCEPMHRLRSADGDDPRRHGIPYGMALRTETPVRPGAGVRGPPAKVHEARCCRTASPSGSARRARAAERAGWRWPAGESRACRVADGCNAAADATATQNGPQVGALVGRTSESFCFTSSRVAVESRPASTNGEGCEDEARPPDPGVARSLRVTSRAVRLPSAAPQRTEYPRGMAITRGVGTMRHGLHL
jgi:hypothetical protein